MALFDRDRREENPRTRRLYALWELIYTFVDFGAAAAFLVGSVLFLYESQQTLATLVLHRRLGAVRLQAHHSHRARPQAGVHG